MEWVYGVGLWGGEREAEGGRWGRVGRGRVRVE